MILRIVPFFQSLDDAGYRALHERTTKAARRGRLAGHVGRLGESPDVPLPPMLPCEDADAGADAIADAWFAMATAKREGPSPRALQRKAEKQATRAAMRAKLALPIIEAREAIDGAVSLACAIAKRLGQRREAHRIRRYRAGLTVATDRTMPHDAEKLTIEQLVAAVPHGRRDAFQRALVKGNYERARRMLPPAVVAAAIA